MGNIIKVGMADLNMQKAPDGLTTLGTWFLYRTDAL